MERLHQDPRTHAVPQAGGVRPPRLKAVVFSDGSRLGRLIAGLAQARGHTVTLFAPLGWGAGTAVAGIRTVAGDLLSPREVDEAVGGQDGVVIAMGSAKSAGATPAEATGVVVQAMARRGLSRVVLVSAVGAGDSRRHAGPILNSTLVTALRRRLLAEKEAQERVVRGTGLRWTIVRAFSLADGRTRRGYRVGSRPSGLWLLPRAGRIQVADFVVRELAEGRHLWEPVTITY